MDKILPTDLTEEDLRLLKQTPGVEIETMSNEAMRNSFAVVHLNKNFFTDGIKYIIGNTKIVRLISERIHINQHA
jgi:hypothetical protein